MPTQDIVVPQKGKTGQLGATQKPAPAGPAAPDASHAPAALPALAALLPGYVSPNKKVKHYERLEQATAASMAESVCPTGSGRPSCTPKRCRSNFRPHNIQPSIAPGLVSPP